MSEFKGVMIHGEVTEGKLSAMATELLGCGRKLANDLGQELSAILVGNDVSSLAGEAIALGADKVYVVEDHLLKDYQTDSYVAVIQKVIKEAMPQVILIGQTSVGRDLAPMLAFKLGTAVTMDCVGLAIDPDSKRLLQTKPVYGGSAQAIYTSDFDPQIVTIRAKVMPPAQPNTSRKGQVIDIQAGLDSSGIRTKVLGKVKAEQQGVKLEDAQVIVSGGRGIGGPQGFTQLAELAKMLKGAVGASRPAVDSGWMPTTSQVGLTGTIVVPDLYIAVAISGSSQHMAGCSGSKTIVAINRDPEANIFKVARYGAVGDWKKILPAFNAKVKELLAE